MSLNEPIAEETANSNILPPTTESTRCHSIKRDLCHYIKTFPVTIGSLGLAMMGLANMCVVIESSWDLHNLSIVAWICFIVADSFFLIMILRFASNLPLEELTDPAVLSSYSAFVMGLLFAFGIIPQLLPSKASNIICTIGVWLCFLLQLCSMFLFFYYGNSIKHIFQPYSFPPVVSLAIVGLSAEQGSSMPRWLIEMCCWTSTVLVVLILPYTIYRVFKEVSACDPTISLLQAPASVLTSVWFGLKGSSLLNNSGNTIFYWVLLVVSSITFLLTLVAIYLRRKVLKDSFPDFSWVSFTFPFISTANSYLVFGSWSNDNLSSEFLTIWGFLIAICTLILILPLMVFLSYFIFKNRE